MRSTPIHDQKANARWPMMRYPVLAVGTQVVASDKQRCDLPVLGEVDVSPLVACLEGINESLGVVEHVTVGPGAFTLQTLHVRIT